MFNRFWRAEESRARRSGGSGLGLSISHRGRPAARRLAAGVGRAGPGRGVPADAAAQRRRARCESSPLPLGPDDRAASRGLRAGAGAAVVDLGRRAPARCPRRCTACPRSAAARRDRCRDAAVVAALAAGAAARPRRARGLRERARELAGAGAAPVGDGDAPVLPPGPVDGSNALDLVRGFVYASGSSPDRHGAARALPRPRGRGVGRRHGRHRARRTVRHRLPHAPVDPEADMRTVRIRGTPLGRLTPGGWFEAAQSPVQIDVNVVRRDGQWRIARLPSGVLVPDVGLPRSTTAPCKTWFVDPVRRRRRAGPALPAGRRRRGRRRPGRWSCCSPGRPRALQGAASTMLVADAQLRSNVATSPDGAADRRPDRSSATSTTPAAGCSPRRSCSRWPRSTSAGSGCSSTAQPLLPDRPDLHPRRRRVARRRVQPGADVPALVVDDGRVHQLNGPDTSTPRCPGRSATARSTRAVGGVEAGRAARSRWWPARAAGAHAAGRRARAATGWRRSAWTRRTMTRPSWTPDRRRGVDGAGRHDGRPRRCSTPTAAAAAHGPVDAEALTAPRARSATCGSPATACAWSPWCAAGSTPAAVARSIGRRGGDPRRPLGCGRRTSGEVVAADWRSQPRRSWRSPAARTARSRRSRSTASRSPRCSAATSPRRCTAVAAAPNRPLLVTDQGGVWSFAGGDQDAWRQVLGGAPDAVPLYPG